MMKIVYKKENGTAIYISEISFKESKHSTMITCDLNSQMIDDESAELKNKTIATGKGLNAADAFISALKDITHSPWEENSPKISDR